MLTFIRCHSPQTRKMSSLPDSYVPPTAAIVRSGASIPVRPKDNSATKEYGQCSVAEGNAKPFESIHVDASLALSQASHTR
jgi:hypothetical protein